jgi:vitamin-K-epoxide reductase (warfarin-sensitive)
MKRISILCYIGIIASLYSIYVVYKNNESMGDDLYIASCDISATISCSKVLTSEYAHIWSQLGLIAKDSMFDFENAVYGIGYYVFLLILSSLAPIYQDKFELFNNIILILSTFSMMLSAYLSYILAEILHDICIGIYLFIYLTSQSIIYILYLYLISLFNITIYSNIVCLCIYVVNILIFLSSTSFILFDKNHYNNTKPNDIMEKKNIKKNIYTCK